MSKFFLNVHKTATNRIPRIKLITPVKLDKIIARIGNIDNPYQIACFRAKFCNLTG